MMQLHSKSLFYVLALPSHFLHFVILMQVVRTQILTVLVLYV